VKLEELGKLKCIVTQNIDNLHQKAGNKSILDLHGNGSRSFCISCGQKYTYADFCKMMDDRPVPRCFCGGVVRPDTVLFDEWLNDNVFDSAVSEIKNSDLLIVIGSSLLVQPAAGLVKERNKDVCKFVIINNTPTLYDKSADLVINENCGDVLEKLITEL
jgi:NAD-dependent deacetylase